MIDWRSSGHEHGGLGSEEDELQRETVHDGQDRALQYLIPDRFSMPRIPPNDAHVSPDGGSPANRPGWHKSS